MSKKALQQAWHDGPGTAAPVSLLDQRRTDRASIWRRLGRRVTALARFVHLLLTHQP